MTSTELTLDAALRDVEHERPDVRNRAIRNLAPALLERVAEQPPVAFHRCAHELREPVVAALEHACSDAAPHNVGLAILGLAQLGAPSARAHALAGLARHDADEATVFVRESSVIALSLLGKLARSESDSGYAVEQLAADIRGLLDDPRDDVRFQAGPALVETLEGAAEPELLAALARETHPEVRENLIEAIALLDPPGPRACDELVKLLADPDARAALGLTIASTLTAAGRPEGGPLLVAALERRDARDTALEALALLGPLAPPDAGEAVAKLTRGLLVPVYTQVRAAYALARIRPSEGEARLDELARSLRPGVREAVGEARGHLEKLAQDEQRRSGSAYRR